MKVRYAEVVSITSQDMTIGGFCRGMHVSEHAVTVTQVTFSGGYQLNCLSQQDDDGFVMVNGYRIEVGDKVRLMALADQVVCIVPEGIAHLPADMRLAAFTNPELGRN